MSNEEYEAEVKAIWERYRQTCAAAEADARKQVKTMADRRKAEALLGG